MFGNNERRSVRNISYLCCYILYFLFEWSHFMTIFVLAEGEFLRLTRQPYFVDQSLFIKDFIDLSEPALAITAPPGFGKTLHLDMLKQFFHVPVDKQGNLLEKNTSSAYAIFKDLKIGQTDYLDYFGSHGVVDFDFKSLRDFKSYRHFLSKFASVIDSAFSRHAYLEYARDEFAQNVNANNFEQCYYTAPDDLKTINTQVLQSNLLFCGLQLSFMVRDFFHTGVLILIDEYSLPFEYILGLSIDDVNLKHDQRGMMKEVTDFLRLFISRLLKNNNSMRFSLLTGVMKFGETASQYTNNLVCESIFDRTQWVIRYGFTEADVDELCSKFNIRAKAQIDMKSYFGGYIPYSDQFSPPVYAPSHVIKYIQEPTQVFLTHRTAAKFSSASALKYFDVLFEQKNFGGQILHCLNIGNQIMTTDPTHLTVDDLIGLRRSELRKDTTSDFKIMEVFFYFLLEHGLFTAHRKGVTFRLQVPNQLMKISLQDKILLLKYFQEFVAASCFEKKEFARIFFSLDRQRHTIEAFTSSLAKLFCKNESKLEEVEFEIVGPMYAIVNEYGPQHVYGEVFPSKPADGENIKDHQGKETLSTVREKPDLVIYGPKDRVTIVKYEEDQVKSEQASSPEKALQFILDNKYKELSDRIGSQNYVLVGIVFNSTHCGCCVLCSTTDMSNRVCATESREIIDNVEKTTLKG